MPSCRLRNVVAKAGSIDRVENTKQRVYPLHQLYFYLTEGCNLRCRHCWIDPKHQRPDSPYGTLDTELFKWIIRQAKPLGLSMVKLTGGEPLLHPYINEILEIVKNEELRLVVETNGTLCTSELAKKLAACANPYVSVSIDGATAETHEWVRGIRGCFDTAVNGIRNLVNEGCRPEVIMTVMRSNSHQIEALVRLAESLGVTLLKLNPVNAIGRGEKMWKARESLTIEELIHLGQWVESTLSTSTDLSIFYSQPPAFRPLGKMFGKNGAGCRICRVQEILGVLWDGSYSLCGIGKTVPDLVFGHAEKDSLEKVWKSNPILSKLRDGLPQKLEGICASCVMRGVCLGNCIAENYHRSRRLWAPFWYCASAYKAELFPQSRIASKFQVA